MANYFVSSTGSNTSPYDTWAKAATALSSAVSAASSSGDQIIIDASSPPADISANTTYTFLNNISIIASTNSGTSTITPTAMGASTWIGSSSASYSLTLAGAYKIYLYGITLRTAGSSIAAISVGVTDNCDFELDTCYLWGGTTYAFGTGVNIGGGGFGGNSHVRLRNCTIRFGHASHYALLGNRVEMYGCTLSSAGSVPTNLFKSANGLSSACSVGCDWSYVGSGNLVDGSPNSSPTYTFSRCKLGSGYVMLGSSTPANMGGAEVYVWDCASGDTHGLMGYANAFGSVVSDSGITYSAGATANSWKIVTTAAASLTHPFKTPWLHGYWTGTSAITPRFEILRDGSTTAYKDDEVWANFLAKVTSGSTAATEYNDRVAVAGTGASQASGAGLGSWAGESGTAWSGKVDSGSSLTPAEVGTLSGRVCVGAASATVYMHPEILTA